MLYQTSGKEIWDYRVMPWQSGFLMSWIQGSFGIGGDSLLCQYFDLNGNPQWAQNLVLCRSGLNNIIYISTSNGSRVTLIPTTGGAYVTYALTYLGGSGGMGYTKVLNNGTIQWPAPGQLFSPNGYAPYITTSDSAGGFYVMMTTGGINAAMLLQRIDATGASVFPSPVDLTAGFSGRGYKWSVMADGNGSFYMVWDSGLGDVLITKVRSNGTKPWTPEVKYLCSATGNQIKAQAYYKNGSVYASWSDPRSPAANYFIYAQRCDSTGNMLWTTDGVQLSSYGSYIPDPRPVALSGGDMLTGFLMTPGFHAQRLGQNGTPVWTINGTPVYTGPTNNNPSYDDYKIIPGPSNTAVIVWSSSSDILAARLKSNGVLTDLTEPVFSDEVQVYPNPAHDYLMVHSVNSKKATCRITDITGRLIIELPLHEKTTIPLLGFAPGMYMYSIQYDNDVVKTGKFIKQ